VTHTRRRRRSSSSRCGAQHCSGALRDADVVPHQNGEATRGLDERVVPDRVGQPAPEGLGESEHLCDVRIYTGSRRPLDAATALHGPVDMRIKCNRTKILKRRNTGAPNRAKARSCQADARVLRIERLETRGHRHTYSHTLLPSARDDRDSYVATSLKRRSCAFLALSRIARSDSSKVCANGTSGRPRKRPSIEMPRSFA
jgi:hypothetical protein